MTDYNKLLKTITQSNYKYYIKGLKDCFTLNDFSDQEVEIVKAYNQGLITENQLLKIDQKMIDRINDLELYN